MNDKKIKRIEISFNFHRGNKLSQTRASRFRKEQLALFLDTESQIENRLYTQTENVFMLGSFTMLLRAQGVQI